MGFNCGIVGLPNVGKSTLFNALSNAKAQAANFPFCTIEPNIGIAIVKDKRLEKLTEISKAKETIPTTIEFVDIAGLVKGASLGEGLGNKFLATIRETDAIIQVVRCFQNDNIIHVSENFSPTHDTNIINSELILADLQIVEKLIDRSAKNAKSGNKEFVNYVDFLKKLAEHLSNGMPIRTLEIDQSMMKDLQQLQLLTTKPMLYLANVDENGFLNNPLLDELYAIAKKENTEVITISAAIEADITSLPEEEQRSFLNELGLQESGLDKMIKAGYDILDLITFFTSGPKESRAWTIKKGLTASQAAGKIHTDFEKGFIRAEVMHCDDFINFGGEQGVKNAGKWRLEGRDYIVTDGDVMHFRFNV